MMVPNTPVVDHGRNHYDNTHNISSSSKKMKKKNTNNKTNIIFTTMKRKTSQNNNNVLPSDHVQSSSPQHHQHPKWKPPSSIVPTIVVQQQQQQDNKGSNKIKRKDFLMSSSSEKKKEIQQQQTTTNDATDVNTVSSSSLSSTNQNNNNNNQNNKYNNNVISCGLDTSYDDENYNTGGDDSCSTSYRRRFLLPSLVDASSLLCHQSENNNNQTTMPQQPMSSSSLNNNKNSNTSSSSIPTALLTMDQIWSKAEELWNQQANSGIAVTANNNDTTNNKSWILPSCFDPCRNIITEDNNQNNIINKAMTSTNLMQSNNENYIKLFSNYEEELPPPSSANNNRNNDDDTERRDSLSSLCSDCYFSLSPTTATPTTLDYSSYHPIVTQVSATKNKLDKKNHHDVQKMHTLSKKSKSIDCNNNIDDDECTAEITAIGDEIELINPNDSNDNNDNMITIRQFDDKTQQQQQPRTKKKWWKRQTKKQQQQQSSYIKERNDIGDDVNDDDDDDELFGESINLTNSNVYTYSSSGGGRYNNNQSPRSHDAIVDNSNSTQEQQKVIISPNDNPYDLIVQTSKGISTDAINTNNQSNHDINHNNSSSKKLNNKKNRKTAPIQLLDIQSNDLVHYESNISEITMISRSVDDYTNNNNNRPETLPKVPIEKNRRMAYYAVGKHHHSSTSDNNNNNNTEKSGNRRCYFTGKIILSTTPYYAGCVQQGLRTLVVFCLPSALGLPLNNTNNNGIDENNNNNNTTTRYTFQSDDNIIGRQKGPNGLVTTPSGLSSNGSCNNSTTKTKMGFLGFRKIGTNSTGNTSSRCSIGTGMSMNSDSIGDRSKKSNHRTLFLENYGQSRNGGGNDNGNDAIGSHTNRTNSKRTIGSSSIATGSHFSYSITSRRSRYTNATTGTGTIASQVESLSLVSIDSDIDINWNYDCDTLLQMLPSVSYELLEQIKNYYPQQYETLPVQVRDYTKWGLYDRFCFFTGLPINSHNEIYYKLKDDISTTLYGEHILLSHEVFIAAEGGSSTLAELLTLPNSNVIRYIQKQYKPQCAKLNNDERVFQRSNWIRMIPE